MAWRIVKQPDGKLARFSEIVDDFTHWDMSEAEALKVCCDKMGREEARAKVNNGIEDLLEDWSSGDGTARWRECLTDIETVHGREHLAEELAEMGFPEWAEEGRYERPEALEEGGV